jgi:predicted Zn-dependent protease
MVAEVFARARPAPSSRRRKPAGWFSALGTRLLGLVVVTCCWPASGCEGWQDGGHKGPGGRSQRLALSAKQELALGRQAMQEVLKEYREVRTGEGPERVQGVGQRIAAATRIEPLQREINLATRGYIFEWEFRVLDNDQVNAFCLPAGKVGVFTGLLEVARTDDQLAAVMGHEIAHALAHHASERIARQQMQQQALQAAGGLMGQMDSSNRHALIGVLAAGAQVNSLKYERAQESEADHIGVFLMTFAGYDPDQSITFWEQMAGASRRTGRPPEILSSHPSDEQRIAQLRQWIPQAKGGKKAFDEGRIAPPPR